MSTRLQHHQSVRVGIASRTWTATLVSSFRRREASRNTSLTALGQIPLRVWSIPSGSAPIIVYDFPAPVHPSGGKTAWNQISAEIFLVTHLDMGRQGGEMRCKTMPCICNDTWPPKPTVALSCKLDSVGRFTAMLFPRAVVIIPLYWVVERT